MAQDFDLLAGELRQLFGDTRTIPTRGDLRSMNRGDIEKVHMHAYRYSLAGMCRFVALHALLRRPQACASPGIVSSSSGIAVGACQCQLWMVRAASIVFMEQGM